ncbi:muramoyltetrapeptide carboxypeptidase [Altererythrobacter xiamenensis]|uniref:Muramoyltetrapeptide carboxypeptidase n=1 Tax=Altererythrobacter xiamenensis TaxID=1316679 RepID=A0A1Y6FNI3_9SPHN|nr:LD-carboxypeptidase [Altererythrobacter xiamenensis]SMQ74770.1 muramoyltetrapeptide carboxypeptidase [Altererythrobacter xiamenensis]
MTRIAVCAPATPITRDHAEAAEALVAQEFPEHSIYFHEQCFKSAGHFAGTDLERLEALVELANDPEYDAVWFAKGGYGSNRIAEAAVTRMNGAARSKTYVGFSDMGYLLAALYRYNIGQPVHGSMPVSARSERGREAVRRVLKWFSGDGSGLEPSLDGKTPAVAFNLITLAMLTNTPMMPDLTGHVVMVEEVSEHLYSVDRLFFHLANTLPRLAGLRLGQVTDVPENYVEFGQEAEDIAKFWCNRAGIPYLGRAEIGHTAANRIVPFGLASPSTAG